MSFDLNINNYSKDELKEIFNLPKFYDVDLNLLQSNETKLRQGILNNKEIPIDTQTKTINFLIKAKNILLIDKGECNITENKNSKDTSKEAKEAKEAKDIKEKVYDFIHASYDLHPVNVQDESEHMIQHRKDNPYLISLPSSYLKGVVNPLVKRTITQNLTIDSRFRDNYKTTSSSNFSVILPIIFNNVFTMQVASIEIPTTFYVISKIYGNNFFSVTINGVSAVVTIPDGNYDVNTIGSVINSQLAILGGYFAQIVFSVNLLLNNGTGKTTVTTSSAPIPMEFDLNFSTDQYGNNDSNTILSLKLGWLLGFRDGHYYNSMSYTSEGIIDLSGPSYIYLVVDDFNNNVNNGYYTAFNSSILNKNILARITINQITSPPSLLGTVQQNNLNVVTTPREYFGPVNLKNMNIQLLDEYGRFIDLNYADFSFCLNLTIQYDV